MLIAIKSNDHTNSQLYSSFDKEHFIINKLWHTVSKTCNSCTKAHWKSSIWKTEKAMKEQKVKFALEEDMKVQKGSRGIPLLFL